MDVGLLLIFQSWRGETDDHDVVANEMRLATLAEELGYDSVWVAEHHFTDYSACPDNIQFLSWVAARTDRIRLCTGAVIVPWNDPLRVVERIALLDHLSGGRAVLGLGRGLSRIEYEHFGIDMSTSRARFDEGAAMILDAIRTGTIAGDGPFYPQVPTPIRPRPRPELADDVFAVGMSPESVEQAARLGARLMVFSQAPWEIFATGSLATYRQVFEATHRRRAPAPVLGDLMYCHEDAAVAEAQARRFMSTYFALIVEHYSLLSDHFSQVSGYEMYATAAELMAAVGADAAMSGYIDLQSWGTPERIVARLRQRRELLGDFDLLVTCNFGGMSEAEAEASVRLFAAEVLPALR